MTYDPSQDTFSRRVAALAQRWWAGLQPGARVRRAAALGAVLAALGGLLLLAQTFRLGYEEPWNSVAVSLLAILLGAVAGGVVAIALRAGAKAILDLPRFVGWGGFMAIAGILLWGKVSLPSFLVPAAFGYVLGEALFFGGAACLFTGGLRGSGWLKKGWIAALVAGGLGANGWLGLWVLDNGSGDHLIAAPERDGAIAQIAAPNPSLPGNYEVRRLSYGSGVSRRRPEFGTGAALITLPVDASDFASLKGDFKWFREWYWGFDVEHVPVNGLVWYPEGPGPFPLALIVHGNHSMEEDSDPGYAYLGEHLAGHGYIFVSVDENFLNYSWSSTLKAENDARGWLLLKHLQVWRGWAGEKGNPFEGKVDLDNIALMGHSRGGEAVAVAAAFNRLGRYPDDATIAFDFDFNIRSVIAIAPVDGQYSPAGRRTEIEDVNYLVVHGAHDADVTHFHGARQYDRVTFTGGEYRFKSSLYIYRANHGQFNTVWGNTDFGFPRSLTLNLKPLLSGEEQRQIGLVYFTAFLEATLKGKDEYLPLFRDHRTAGDWLPNDHYISRFEDSSFRTLNDYENDVDVTTGSHPGVTIEGEGLALWREQKLPYRKGGDKHNSVAYIGWDRKNEDPGEEPPAYSFVFPGEVAASLKIGHASTLVFTLTVADEKIPEDSGSRGEPADRSGRGARTKPEKNGATPDPLDLSIELRDSDGASVSLPLSQFRPIPPILPATVGRLWNTRERSGTAWEPTLQTFELPLSAFVEINSDFQPAALAGVRFVFDRSPTGVVILDKVGFSAPPR